jgi:hypothetical protein
VLHVKLLCFEILCCDEETEGEEEEERGGGGGGGGGKKEGKKRLEFTDITIKIKRAVTGLKTSSDRVTLHSINFNPRSI